MITDNYKITKELYINGGEVHIELIKKDRKYVIPQEIIMSKNSLGYILEHRKRDAMYKLIGLMQEPDIKGLDFIELQEELLYLKFLNDEYVFFSEEKNNYVAFSDSKKLFENIIEQFISKYGKLVK